MMVKGYSDTPSTIGYQPVNVLCLIVTWGWPEISSQTDSWAHLLVKNGCRVSCQTLAMDPTILLQQSWVNTVPHCNMLH